MRAVFVLELPSLRRISFSAPPTEISPFTFVFFCRVASLSCSILRCSWNAAVSFGLKKNFFLKIPPRYPPHTGALPIYFLNPPPYEVSPRFAQWKAPRSMHQLLSILAIHEAQRSRSVDYFFRPKVTAPLHAILGLTSPPPPPWLILTNS